MPPHDTLPDQRDDAGFDPGAALDAALPALIAARNEGIALTTAAGVIAVLCGWLWLAGGPSDDARGQFLSLGCVLGLSGAFAAIVRTRRRHGALVLPAVAGALGLSHASEDSAFLSGLPPRLLPRGGRRRAEDVLTGTLGGRSIRFAEVRIETGGRRSTTLFRGVVIEAENAVALPSFLIAPEGAARGLFGMRGRIDVSDLNQIGSFDGGHARFGVWSTSAEIPDDPRLRAVTDVLSRLGERSERDALLYSAMCDRTRTWIALRGRRDLFRVGGLFATRDSLLADLRDAAVDFGVPLRLVDTLVAAETAAAVAMAMGVVSPPPDGSAPQSTEGAGRSAG